MHRRPTVAQRQLALGMPLLEVAACARSRLRNDMLDRLVEKTIDLTLVPVRGGAVNVEAYVQHIDMAVEAQRNLQRLIQD